MALAATTRHHHDLRYIQPDAIDSRSAQEAPMTDFSRRNLLGVAGGGMLAVAATTDGSAAGQPPFGPTPPVLAGAQLPTFRFRLGAITPKTWDGGWAKEATVEQFPVSEKLAGVLMSLQPGAIRELHWHANAAEWAYVIKGQ